VGMRATVSASRYFGRPYPPLNDFELLTLRHSLPRLVHESAGFPQLLNTDVPAS
jgi:hypothetical protein